MNESFECKIEDEAKPFEVSGSKGLKSTPFRKTFKNQAQFEKWLEKNGDTVTIHAFSRS